MQISIVVAYDKNRVIGKDNRLPWPKIEEDLKHFHDLTIGHHNLAGRKTYESIGKVLADRTMVVVTRTKGFEAEGCVVVGSVKEGIDYARSHKETELMIIGGQEIYEQALPYVDRIYATEILAEFSGDTRFPETDEGQWVEVSREEHPEINPPLVYRTLERR